MKKTAKPAAIEPDEDDAPLITPELLAKGKVTTYPRPPAGTNYRKSVKDGDVSMTASRGGVRPGAGRKPTGHVPLRLNVSPAVRKRIEAEAKKRNTTLSAVVEEAFGKYHTGK